MNGNSSRKPFGHIFGLSEIIHLCVQGYQVGNATLKFENPHLLRTNAYYTRTNHKVCKKIKVRSRVRTDQSIVQCGTKNTLKKL